MWLAVGEREEANKKKKKKDIHYTLCYSMVV